MSLVLLIIATFFLSYQTQCLLFQNKATTESKVKTCPCSSLQQCVSLCAWAYVCLLLIVWLWLSCEASRSRNYTRFQELAFTRQREKRQGTSNASHSPYPYFLHSYLLSCLALSALSSQPSLFFFHKYTFYPHNHFYTLPFTHNSLKTLLAVLTIFKSKYTKETIGQCLKCINSVLNTTSQLIILSLVDSLKLIY